MTRINSAALRRWLRVDALNRAWRTVLQGIVLTALSAAGDVVLQAVKDGGVHDWKQVGHAAASAFASSIGLSILAYLHRTIGDPSSIPSAQPPAPPVGSAPATTPAPIR